MDFFDSVGSFFTDTIPSLFDGDSAATTDVLSQVGNVTKDASDKGFWSSLGDSLMSPTGLSTVLQTGLGLYKGLGEADAAKRQEEAQRLADKNKMLLEMAKIKAGGGGGGGGGGNSRLAANQAIIDAIRSGYNMRSGALNNWANNYMRAYGK